jgi:hypothetical protein
MVDEIPKAAIDWKKVDVAIDKINEALYSEDMNLLEIDIIINTIWTTATKNKVAQLALNTLLQGLYKEQDKIMKDVEKEKPRKGKAPGIG